MLIVTNMKLPVVGLTCGSVVIILLSRLPSQKGWNSRIQIHKTEVDATKIHVTVLCGKLLHSIFQINHKILTTKNSWHLINS